jgi:hypothetical protein
MQSDLTRALMLGALGAAVAWLLAGPLASSGFQFWAVIAGWAAMAAGGRGVAALAAALAGAVWGAVMATAALLAGVVLGGTATIVAAAAGAALALALAGQAMLRVLSSRPAILIGFASTWGYAKLARLDATNFALGAGPFTTIALSLAIGVVLGWLIEVVLGLFGRDR